MMDPLNTYRKGSVEAVVEIPNLYVFMYTKEWVGEYIVISVRSEYNESDARSAAAMIYSDTFKQKGHDWKDENQAFYERANLVEFVDADYFNNHRESKTDSWKEGW
jgi:hypothetical protein